MQSSTGLTILMLSVRVSDGQVHVFESLPADASATGAGNNRGCCRTASVGDFAVLYLAWSPVDLRDIHRMPTAPRTTSVSSTRPVGVWP